MEQPPGPAPQSSIRRGGQVRPGSRAGDRRLRLTRVPQEQRIKLPVERGRPRPWHPALVFLYTFGGLVLAGTVLLSLPIANTTGEWTPVLDALFTATSADTGFGTKCTTAEVTFGGGTKA